MWTESGGSSRRCGRSIGFCVAFASTSSTRRKTAGGCVSDMRRTGSSCAAGKRMKPLEFESPPKRILLIKPSAIGDVVHALPILALLRKRWPAAHIAWLLTPACVGLLEGHPMLDEVLVFDRRKFGRGWRDPASALGLVEFLKSLREHKF